MTGAENNIDNQKSVTLTITERCDLACVYCYEHNKTAKQMSFETAKNIIDKELINLDKYRYTIEFFGGEPFLNFDLIKQVVEYTLNNYRGYYHFFITTNGTQVHNEIQEWLTVHKNSVSVGLSLDGNKIPHNLNRSNSFDKIDLDFFKTTYPEQTIKMTISELSLPYLYESIKFITENGFLISCNLAYMVDWLSDKNKPILEEQLDKLIQYYIDNPSVPRCSMMDFKIDILAKPEKHRGFIDKYCGCGTHMICYDINGDSFPCQLFSPLSAGEKAIPSKNFKIDREIKKELYGHECATCYYQRICQTCLGSNYLSTGDIYKVDATRCQLYKIIFKANAKLRALEWERGLLKCDDEQAMLRSILAINETKD